MTFCVKSQIGLLQALKTASPKLIKAILKNTDSKLIDAFSEISYNYMRGNVKCGDSHMKKLRKFKKTIRKLGAESKKNTNKRKILLQSGGSFVRLLLSPILTELAGYLTQKALE